jgi:uncharacterized membrane-anchored protein
MTRPPLVFDSLDPRSHPQRAMLTAEMHLRKPPRLEAPGQMLQFVMLAAEGDMDAAEAYLRHHIAPLAAPRRFWTGEVEGFAFAYERHSEFITYSFIAAEDRPGLFDIASFAAIQPHIDAIPGRLMRANHVRLLRGHAPLPSAGELARHFSGDDLIASMNASGTAMIWSDFRIHDDGFGRLLIVDRGMEGSDASLLTQRLQELGNYRKMALLGLPIAQDMMPRVGELEQQLADLAERVADEASDDDRTMADISRLSAEIARIGAQTRFRMSGVRRRPMPKSASTGWKASASGRSPAFRRCPTLPSAVCSRRCAPAPPSRAASTICPNAPPGPARCCGRGSIRGSRGRTATSWPR